MIPAQLDAMQAAAGKRLQEFINRSAAQHLRHMESAWHLYDLKNGPMVRYVVYALPGGGTTAERIE